MLENRSVGGLEAALGGLLSQASSSTLAVGTGKSNMSDQRDFASVRVSVLSVHRTSMLPNRTRNASRSLSVWPFGRAACEGDGYDHRQSSG
jgi:hypothetical protein